MELNDVMEAIKSKANQYDIEELARYGIKARKIYGVSTPSMKELAKAIGKDHRLALKLWDTDVYEARIIACWVDDPGEVTDAQMENWASGFDSWALCDACCMNLFDKTKFAYAKAEKWSGRSEEFVKRAGFALMATLAIHDKNVGDDPFIGFLGRIKSASNDDRNLVMKGASWALRQIGKRNVRLNILAIDTAHEIMEMDTKSARWIASDAIRELKGVKVQERLARAKKKKPSRSH